jgi:hypothetical protein
MNQYTDNRIITTLIFKQMILKHIYIQIIVFSLLFTFALPHTGSAQQILQADYQQRVSQYSEDFTGGALPAIWTQSSEGYEAEVVDDALVLRINKNVMDNTYKLGPLWIENFDLKPYTTIQYKSDDSLEVAVQLIGPGGSVSGQQRFLLPASDEWTNITLNMTALASEEWGFHLDSILWVFEPEKADYSGTMYINEILIGDSPSGKTFDVDIEEAVIPEVDLGPADTTLSNTLFMELDAGNEGAAYLWNTGETTRTIRVDTSGVYSVVVIGDYHCTSEDFISITFISSGLEETQHQTFSLSIYPNPVHNMLFLKSKVRGKEENVTVTIINQTGKTLLMRTFEELSPDETYEINLGSVPAGLYLVRTSFADHKYITRKIIVY